MYKRERSLGLQWQIVYIPLTILFLSDLANTVRAKQRNWRASTFCELEMAKEHLVINLDYFMLFRPVLQMNSQFSFSWLALLAQSSSLHFEHFSSERMQGGLEARETRDG